MTDYMALELKLIVNCKLNIAVALFDVKPQQRDRAAY